MVNPTCPICGNQDNEFCFSERKHQVIACHTCELFFIYPYPDENDSHNRVLEYSYDKLTVINPEKHYTSSVINFKKYFPLIEQECSEAKSMLDVGCGTGHLLELLGGNHNIHRVGIELNAQRAEYAKRIADCEIFQIPLEKFKYTRKFDVITMINVLSHIPSFDRLFSSIRSLLIDNGKLILKVGEMTGGVKKNAAFDWGIPDHMHFLGMSTIQYICEKYGFKILTHTRQPLSAVLFSKNRWRQPGRSKTRNTIKRIVVMTPLALPIIRILYDYWYGRKMFSSFIVLSPINQ